MKQVIVMAAGLGSRLKELTKDCPKPLLKINDKPIIERNIEYMIEASIDRIVIIVGYMAERFRYLKDKYSDQIDIVFVNNERYRDFNTIYSMYCARKYFDCDSYIVTADNYLLVNLYSKYQDCKSFYLLRPTQYFEKEEWTVELGSDRRFISVDTHGHYGYSYSGISFWTKRDLSFIKKCLEEVEWNDEKVKTMYWDNVLLDRFEEFPVYANVLESNSDFFEIDDENDINILETHLREGLK